jgi:CHAT domain-containing protein
MVEDYQTQIAQHKINFDFRLGKEIFDLLMKEALREVPASARLIIVPDGLLLRFPFEALVTTIEGGAPRYLLEDHAISYAPSASVLAQLMGRQRSQPAGRLDLLALGNPVADAGGTADRALSEQFRAGARLEPLPFAEEEASSIVRLYRQNRKTAELYVRDQALEGVLKADAGKFRILHLATHGFIDDRVPALSGLLLASGGAPDGEDGYLRLNEIFHLKMNADLAVLSACETALGKEIRGEGMVGLTRAFFYAGAQSVIASLWMVNDQSTALLMEDLHARHIKGEDASTALRRAKLGLLRGSDSRFRHPFFWAPFVLVGPSR